MRYGFRIAAVAYVVVEFLTPSLGIIQANAQAAGNQTGDAFTNQTNREPAQVGIVGPFYKNRLVVNPDGSINFKQVPSSAILGTFSYTAAATSGQVFSPVATRRLLSVKNESTTASIAVNFGAACTAALNTAGNYTIGPGAVQVWNTPGAVPTDGVCIIASVGSTPVTIEVRP